MIAARSTPFEGCFHRLGGIGGVAIRGGLASKESGDQPG